MRAFVYVVVMALPITLSCNKKNNDGEVIAKQPGVESLEKKSKVVLETITYKSKSAPEIIRIIEYYEHVNKSWPGPGWLLTIEGTDENVKVTVLAIDNTPIKINAQVKKGDKTITTEYYLKDQYLSFVKEVEILNQDSSVLREDHFYFDRNDLLKKVSNQNYEFVFSSKVLLQDQKRMRDELDRYSTVILNQLMKSM